MVPTVIIYRNILKTTTFSERPAQAMNVEMSLRFYENLIQDNRGGIVGFY